MSLTFGFLTFQLRKRRVKAPLQAFPQQSPTRDEDEWTVCDVSEASLCSEVCSLLSEDHYTEGKFTHIVRSPRVNNEFQESSRIQSAAISSAPSTTRAAAAQLSPLIMVPSTKNSYWEALHERATFFSLVRDYSTQRRLFWDILDKFFLLTNPVPPPGDSEDVRKAHDKSLHGLWQDLQTSMKSLQDYELRLRTSDGRLNVIEKKLDNGKPFTPLSVKPAHSNATHGPAFRSQQPPMSNGSGKEEPAIVKEYYQHAGAIRYLSDELMALGPQPLPLSTLGSEAGQEDDSEVDPDILSPREHVLRRLQLLSELRHAKNEEARLRTECGKKGYELEEDDEFENGDYMDAMNFMETGPPHIDSLLMENTHDIASTIPLQMESQYTGHDGRITNWIAEVNRSTSTALRSELPPDIHSLVIEPSAINSGLSKIATPTKLADKASTSVQLERPFYPEQRERRYSAPELDFVGTHFHLKIQHFRSASTPKL